MITDVFVGLSCWVVLAFALCVVIGRTAARGARIEAQVLRDRRFPRRRGDFDLAS